ncbi:hypothetical protein BSP14_060 [Bacillus phage BSP14]|nr:hypothetical protein BSP14_060 [Bacillus phage BSP14]
MLVNKDLANKEVATVFGAIKFNHKGESKDLSPEQEKQLEHVRGFSIIEEKKAETTKEKAEAKEVKTEEKKTRKKPAKKEDK